ncbi:hypothetical protein Cob_v008980 [Colletotrichum orbiculare MAFF 240422]|uniref:Uncharacterized protein n=1 Tax=Colletotrichum orbiculare (strain 104-T / ATCC 96160 / CBS 514.97 / LARS 414 / MAFF 240422) TaxID=1213857 RepID=A0A484FIC1_COLOR|nr:hypothetical protein Cob_v008980 [Colletotrichum orbiculare MAFF 240422]
MPNPYSNTQPSDAQAKEVVSSDGIAIPETPLKYHRPPGESDSPAEGQEVVTDTPLKHVQTTDPDSSFEHSEIVRDTPSRRPSRASSRQFRQGRRSEPDPIESDTSQEDSPEAITSEDDPWRTGLTPQQPNDAIDPLHDPFFRVDDRRPDGSYRCPHAVVVPCFCPGTAPAEGVPCENCTSEAPPCPVSRVLRWADSERLEKELYRERRRQRGYIGFERQWEEALARAHARKVEETRRREEAEKARWAARQAARAAREAESD